MMFESANFLLKKNLTGTVNHLDLLVERYLRAKNTLETKIEEDSLADFALYLTDEGAGTRRCLFDVNRLPSTCLSHLLGRSAYSKAKLRFQDLDSVSNPSSDTNSYVEFKHNLSQCVGQLLFFFDDDNGTKCVIMGFCICKTLSCSLNCPLNVVSYYEVKPSDHVFEIELCAITSKLMRIDVLKKTYLTPVLLHFEHD